MFNKALQSYVRHLERMFGTKSSIPQCLTQMNCLLNFAETMCAAKGLLELWKVFSCVHYLKILCNCHHYVPEMKTSLL